MSERRHAALCSVPNTTANAVCYIHWHYSVVGATVTLALLEHVSVLLKWHPAPCRMQTMATTEVQVIGRGVPFSQTCSWCVYLACCIVDDRLCLRCPVLKPLMLCCPPAAPCPPCSSLNAPVGEQRFALCLAKLRPVMCCIV